MEMIGDNIEINDGEKDDVMEIIPVMMRIFVVNMLWCSSSGLKSDFKHLYWQQWTVTS